MPLTDSELIDRHSQALREAHGACQKLARNADPTYIKPRGELYATLRTALQHLEGTCRQLGAFRGDARWLKLGIVYAKTMRGAQSKFVRQDWLWFQRLMPLFENGMRSMQDLKDMRTGRLSDSPILPNNPSKWLHLPDHVPDIGKPKVLN
jgi:hypothetical protein